MGKTPSEEGAAFPPLEGPFATVPVRRRSLETNRLPSKGHPPPDTLVLFLPPTTLARSRDPTARLTREDFFLRPLYYLRHSHPQTAITFSYPRNTNALDGTSCGISQSFFFLPFPLKRSGFPKRYIGDTRDIGRFRRPSEL